MNVIEGANHIASAMRQSPPAFRDLARRVRADLIDIAFVDLPADMRRSLLELGPEWTRPDGAQLEVTADGAYHLALLDAIRATWRMEQAPMQTEGLIAYLHAALLRCRAPAAAHVSRSKGGKESSKARRDKSTDWQQKALELKRQGHSNKVIAARTAKSASTISRFLQKIASA